MSETDKGQQMVEALVNLRAEEATGFFQLFREIERDAAEDSKAEEQ